MCWSLIAKIFTSFGLVLGIFGAIMLWKFGLPPDVRRGGVGFLQLEQHDPEEEAKAKRYDLLANIAIWMIVASFVLQFLASIYAFTQN